MAAIHEAAAVVLRRPRSLALATAIVLCGVAPAARAYQLVGERWPGTTITYYPSAYRKATVAGANNWNNANVGIRFVRTSSKAAADLVVSYGAPQCEGESLVGYQGPFTQSWIHLGRSCDRNFMILTATHELGHILGLGHAKHKCARMDASVDLSGTPEFCHHHSLSYWLKHPLLPDDIRGARKLYG
jgi:hypothetical protein